MALLRWLLKAFLVLVLLVVLVIAVPVIFKIPLDLTRFKPQIEQVISGSLARPVTIDGAITISTSMTPYFLLEGLRIGNPEGFSDQDLLAMAKARIQLALLPLLQLRLHIKELLIEDFAVNLEENDAGAPNWVFATKEKTEEIPHKEEPATKSEEGEDSALARFKEAFQLSHNSVVVDRVELNQILLTRKRPGEEDLRTLELTNGQGAMPAGEPLQLEMQGRVLENDYTIAIQLASLLEFIQENRSWVAIKAEILKTKLSFTGYVDLATAARSLTLETRVEGEDLSSLNALAHLELPPFTNYQLVTELHLAKDHYQLKELGIKTGSSSLSGIANVRVDEGLTVVDLKLDSPLIQIDDFFFDTFSWIKEDEDEEDKNDAKEPAEIAEGTEQEQRRLLDPEVLGGYQISLAVESKKVMSGKDFVGGGRLVASLEDGRIRVEPLELSLPGGGVLLEASIRPGKENSDAALRVSINKFDIGIMARRKKPDTDMGGLVNLEVDLESTAGSLPELLKNGNGYFDFSGELENFSSGLIDLWAVNLVAAIVANSDKDNSQLNCAVGRWTMKDGLLSSDTFFIDTSRIRICGQGEVDIQSEQIAVTAAPKAKRAQFFSLATPLSVEGSFDDLDFGLGGAVGLVGTVVRFAASPVTAPVSRLFSDTIPQDGSDVCGMEIGPVERSGIRVPLCGSN